MAVNLLSSPNSMMSNAISSAANKRWAAADSDEGMSGPVMTFGLRRSDKSSIAPKKPMRRGSDTMSEPPAFTSSQRNQSLVVSPVSKKSDQPIAPPLVVVENKKDKLEDSLKQLDIEDITETELTEDLSDSNDVEHNAPSMHEKFSESLGKGSAHTAPADVRRYSKPIVSSTTTIDKDERYASFDSGFGERRESRMRRVQRIKSSDRVMPSLESQQRAIANRRRGTTKAEHNSNGATASDRTQQELDSVRSSSRKSIKERMAMFDNNGSESELAVP